MDETSWRLQGQKDRWSRVVWFTVSSGDVRYKSALPLKKGKREAHHSFARPKVSGKSRFFPETTGCMVGSALRFRLKILRDLPTLFAACLGEGLLALLPMPARLLRRLPGTTCYRPFPSVFCRGRIRETRRPAP